MFQEEGGVQILKGFSNDVEECGLNSWGNGTPVKGFKQEKRPLATLGEMLRYPRVAWRPEPGGKTG